MYAACSSLPERLVQLLSLQPGGPGVIIPAVFPGSVAGITDPDRGGNIPLAETALLAPLLSLFLGPPALLLRQMRRPLDRTPAGCHDATVYEQCAVR